MNDFLIFNAAFPSPQVRCAIVAPPARCTTRSHPAKVHLKTIGMTQRQAAARLGVSESYLNRVLNGELSSRSLMSRVLAFTPEK